MPINHNAQGKRNRRIGADFERQFRKELTESGWFVDRWSNQVDLMRNKIVAAKTNKFMMRTCGFPDFVVFKKVGESYKLYLVECKTNGRLSKEEKEKMEFLIRKGFRCFVAMKKINGSIKIREYVGSDGKKD